MISYSNRPTMQQQKINAVNALEDRSPAVRLAAKLVLNTIKDKKRIQKHIPEAIMRTVSYKEFCSGWECLLLIRKVLNLSPFITEAIDDVEFRIAGRHMQQVAQYEYTVWAQRLNEALDRAGNRPLFPGA